MPYHSEQRRASIDVEVLVWEDDPDDSQIPPAVTNHHGISKNIIHVPGNTLTPYRSTQTLYWNIASLAVRKGFKNVPALAEQMGVWRQAVYHLWRSQTAQMALKTLERLCLALACGCGGWFTFQVGAEGQAHLVWNVQAQARARGLLMTTLSLKAEVHLSSLTAIWNDTAQAVAPSTLARIAYTLNTPSQPFAIGDLLLWDDECSTGNE